MTREEIKSTLLEIVKKHRGVVQDLYIPKGDISANNSETKKDLQAIFDFKVEIQEYYRKKIQQTQDKIDDFKAEMQKVCFLYKVKFNFLCFRQRRRNLKILRKIKLQ